MRTYYREHWLTVAFNSLVKGVQIQLGLVKARRIIIKLFYNAILLAGGQNQRHTFFKGMIRKVIKWCCHICFPNISFISKNRNKEKAILEMLKAPICHVDVAINPDSLTCSVLKNTTKQHDQLMWSSNRWYPISLEGCQMMFRRCKLADFKKLFFSPRQTILSYFCSMSSKIACSKVPLLWKMKPDEEQQPSGVGTLTSV